MTIDIPFHIYVSYLMWKHKDLSPISMLYFQPIKDIIRQKAKKEYLDARFYDWVFEKDGEKYVTLVLLEYF